MTIREFYEHVLTELNKVEAPSLLLEDFNYFANKAVQQYTNKIYNRYDTTQQTTDDLGALKLTTRLEVDIDDKFGESAPNESKTYYCQLPTNYLHLLNCVVEFTGGGVGMCKSETKKQSMARRLTSDMYPSIISNAYFKPSYRCPYYFINNTKKELVDDYESALKMILNPNANEAPDFYDNLRMEIRCGNTRV